MPKPFVIDFANITMNTTMANDHIMPPVFELVQNVNIAYRGRIRKRPGIDEHASNNPTGTRINAIAQWRASDLNTTSYAVAVVDDEIWAMELMTGTWSQIATGITNANAYPWHIAWGINESNVPVVYMTRNSTGAASKTAVQAIELSGADTVVEIGSNTDASNPFATGTAVEYWLDKLWVADGADRLYYSVTGDHNDFYGTGSGTIDLRYPRGGTSSDSEGIVGLRKYRDRLYVLSGQALHVITGRTDDTFGTNFIREQYLPNGATFYQVGDFLFYIDRQGIWQFNGTTSQNLITGSMLEKWIALDDDNDISDATASWDEISGCYFVYFPAMKQEWCYNFFTGQWAINTFASTDSVRVISPPQYTDDSKPTPHLYGTLTNAKVLRGGKGTDDDGNAITMSVRTGHIRLGELGGNVGDRFRIEGIDIETVQQDQTGVVKITMTIDGTAGTQVSLTVDDAGASADTFPTSYDSVDGNAQIDLTDANLVGKYFQLQIDDDDANALADIRRIVVWYETLLGKAG